MKLKTTNFEYFDAAEYAAYNVIDTDFQAAAANASFWAKCRCMRKMTKVVWRKAEWRPMNKQTGQPAGVYRQPLPPSDIEAYVKSFVWNNKDKGVVSASDRTD